MKNIFKKSVIWWITFFITVWVCFVVYWALTNLPAKVWTGSWLTANSWNMMVDSLTELDNRFWTLTSGKMCTSNGVKIDCNTTIPSASDCIWASIWTACGGWKYAGGWIVAMTADLAASTWDSAVTACLARTDWWFTDWRLPTLDELYILYIKNASIWGFSLASWYWSGTQYSSTYARGICFSNGNATSLTRTDS